MNKSEGGVKRGMLDFEKAKKALLVRRAQQGDADAFEQLVTPYEQKIYALCLRMMAHREDAQDAAQEAMLRLYRSMSSFRGDADFGTFVYRVTTNVCMDALRKQQVRAGESLDALYDEGFSPKDDTPGPEEALMQAEEKERLSQAIDQLSEEMRLPLVLREIHELSYEEVAQTLGIGMGTVKSRIYRAREKLARLLASGENAGEKERRHDR